MDSIELQILDFAKNVDSTTRKKIVTQLRNLSIALEDGDDTLQRLSNTPLQLYGAWIGSSLKIFDALCQSDDSLSLETLSHETQADSVLLGRLLRYMSSVKLCDETAQDQFRANNVTKTLATARGENYINLYYNIVNPVFSELPRFLQRTGFQNPYDDSVTAFQDAFKFEGPIYAWWQANPDKAAIFNKHMEYRREDGGDWLDVFPIERYGTSCTPDQVLFVDLGGGIGHQCARLKTRHPNLTGRVILQDLEFAIQSALDTSGVENMVHDAFKPQPIRDARMYYIRGVLHCFTDDKCIQILRNVAPSMGPNSFVLIDEAVLPDANVYWQMTQQDVLMMSSMASMERTRKQWEKIVSSAGMRIVEVHVYSPSLYESVIVAVSA